MDSDFFYPLGSDSSLDKVIRSLNKQGQVYSTDLVQSRYSGAVVSASDIQSVGQLLQQNVCTKMVKSHKENCPCNMSPLHDPTIYLLVCLEL